MPSGSQVIDLAPVETERLSPAAFLKLVKENPGVIKSSQVITPTLGGNNFGSFEVTYTRPMYRALISGKKPVTR